MAFHFRAWVLAAALLPAVTFADEALIDLSPYFADGTLQKAKRAFDRGDYRGARALLDTQPPTHPVRFLRALAAARSGQRETAAAELEALALDYPALADRCLMGAAQARAKLGQTDEAIALYLRVSDHALEFPAARFSAAELLEARGEEEAAIDVLEPVSQHREWPNGRDRRAEALFTMAQLARRANDPQKEKALLFAVWSRFPTGALAAQAGRRLQGTRIPKGVELDRAQTLLDAHQNEAGIARARALQRQLAAFEPLWCRARLIEAKGLRKERRHGLVLKSLREVPERCTEEDLKARALFQRAVSEEVLKPKLAPQTYEAVAAQFPAHPLADDALFTAAELRLRAGELGEASDRLEQLLVRYGDGEWAAEALFQKFWSSWKQGEAEAGLKYLSRTEALTRGPKLAEQKLKARYWKARTLLALNDEAGAVELFTALALSDPSSYYGLLARWRLEALDPLRAQKLVEVLQAPAPADVTRVRVGSVRDDPHFRAGVELLRLGMKGASSELLAIDRDHPEAPMRVLVEALNAAGHERAARRVAGIAPRAASLGPMTAELREVWRAAYPDRYGKLVKRFSRSANIDPYLLWALMREESGFDARARSPVGARGLTQLMPETARSLAGASLKVESLYEPSKNIRLGSRYLASLLKKFEHREAFAVASYNAGPGAVRRWLKARPDAEMDEWVEEIPFDETRAYVKKVLSSYSTYQLLYGAKPKPMAHRLTAPVASEPPMARQSVVAGPPSL